MAENVLPNGLSRLMGELAASAEIKMGVALGAVGDAVAEQARINAESGEHEYGSPTPATANVTGPAKISGDLIENIGREDLIQSAGAGTWHMKVGTSDAAHTDYDGKGSPRTVSEVATYLEVEGTYGYFYRFLGPAAQFASEVSAATVMREIFARPRSV